MSRRLRSPPSAQQAAAECEELGQELEEDFETQSQAEEIVEIDPVPDLPAAQQEAVQQEAARAEWVEGEENLTWILENLSDPGSEFSGFDWTFAEEYGTPPPHFGSPPVDPAIPSVDVEVAGPAVDFNAPFVHRPDCLRCHKRDDKKRKRSMTH